MFSIEPQYSILNTQYSTLKFVEPTFSQSHLVWLIPGLPLLGFFLHAFIGKKLPRSVVGGIATAVVFASFAVSVIVLQALMGQEGAGRAWASLIPGADYVPWIDIGAFRVDFRALIDPLSMLMCLIVTGIGGLIHLYATGYMAEDKDYPRFFTYLNLFIFFMLTLVLGENILLMFVGWEGVGLCSYLLISFWFEDTENSKAGNKAFIVNRIGDVGFGLGVLAIFAAFGTLTFYTPQGTGFLDMAAKGITASGPLLPTLATVIGLLLFIGATGKSAQVPLYIWLPDAMAGPTPVSALIHAATMVTAGVVMITRVSPLIVHSQIAMTVIAIVGIFTAILAASIALTQNDIKKVLAYSTVSQLGYMFVGCGVGAFSAGMFHVTTHAFFKALLFLGAGSVIHALSGEQDLRRMGGLAKRIPITYWTMVAGWLAICGIPPLAGFWSKDEILGFSAGYHPRGFESIGMAIYIVGLITAFMTAFYMSRLMWKAFWTNQRFVESELGGAHAHGSAVALEHEAEQYEEHAVTHGVSDESAAEPHADSGHGHGHTHRVHESPPSMWIPLAILAFLSVVGGFINLPFHGWERFASFLKPSVAAYEPHHGVSIAAGLAIGAAIGIAGVLAAYLLYSKRRETGELIPESEKQKNPAIRGSQNLWYVDQGLYQVFVTFGGKFATAVWKIIDKGIIDGIVGATAFITGLFSEIFRRAQTGYVRNYALTMLVGVVAVVGGLLWGYFGR